MDEATRKIAQRIRELSEHIAEWMGETKGMLMEQP
jgi:hypothetical protein